MGIEANISANAGSTTEVLDYALQVFRSAIMNRKARTFDDCLKEALYVFSGDKRIMQAGQCGKACEGI